MVQPGALKAEILYGNDATEEWELVAQFEVAPRVEPNWETMTPAQALELKQGKWRAFDISNGETIEIQVIYDDVRGHITMHVRQGVEPVAMLMVMAIGTPQTIFLTRANATIDIRFYCEAGVVHETR
jgi:hypothetical protein